MSAGPLETAADRARKWAKEQAASAAAADAATAALAPPKGAKVVHLPPEDKGYWFAAGIVMTHTFPLVFCAMMWGLHDGKSCNRDLSTYLLAQALFSMMHIGVYAPTYLMMFQDYGDVRDTLSLVPNTGLYYFTSTQIYLELAWTCMGVVWTAEAIACQVDLRRAAFWTSVYMLVVGNTGNFFFHIVVPCWLHNYHGAHGADPTIAVAKPFDKPKGPAEAGVGDFFTLKDNVKLWDAPDGRGGVIGQLSKGTTVRIEDVSETGKWTKVSCFRPDGSELSGWVLKRCLGDGCDVETFESSRPERRTLIIEEEVDDLETAGGGRRRAKDLNRKGRFYNRLVYPDVVPPVKQAAPEGVNPAANAHAPTIGRRQSAAWW